MGQGDRAIHAVSWVEPAEFEEAVATLDLPTLDRIADYVGCGDATALDHLSALEESGRLSRRDVGPTTVWDISATSGAWCGLGKFDE